MDADQIFTLAASATFFGLAVLGATRSKRSTLAVPTALVCVDLFAYNALELLGGLAPDEPSWQWLENAAAAMAAPLLFHLTLTFLGARRARRSWLLSTYAYFGAIAASCALPFVFPAWSDYPGGDVWALAMLAGLLVAFPAAGVLLVRYFRASTSSEERARTQLYILTVFVGVGGPALDLASIAGASNVPRLAAPCMLVSALLLTALSLRLRVLRGTVAMLALSAALLGLVGVIAHLLVFRYSTHTALLVVGTVSVTLLLLMAARSVWSSFGEHRERTAHLATLGRLSGQMAHDIRNPLAAIHGAAQYLEEERRRGGTLEEHGEFVELILEQTVRLEKVVQDYRRLGRAEPELRATDLGELVRKVAAASERVPEATDKGVKIAVELDAPGTHQVDPDLLETALENLVRNAIEAMERPGTVTLSAELGEAGGRSSIVLSVRDDGPGMDARTREQAEEAFFTTKAQGSGLGLAFVRRVAEAHGGELRLESALGRGTSVALVLPSDGRPSHV